MNSKKKNSDLKNSEFWDLNFVNFDDFLYFSGNSKNLISNSAFYLIFFGINQNEKIIIYTNFKIPTNISNY